MVNFLKRAVEPCAGVPALGLVLGLAFILGTIVLSTHSLLAFFSIEGLGIVVGGVMTVAFVSFAHDDVRKAIDAVLALFKKPKDATRDQLHHDMAEIIAWAYIVKEQGLRRLEASLAKRGVSDPFVRYGFNMVVSGYTPEDVRAMMETAADACYEREIVPVHVLQAMASHAPAFGMIGTLVGMVAMLCNLHDDIASIGPSLSVSFLSTLYGVVSARMIYMPAAAKLRQAVVNQRFRNHLITEGMVLLVSEKGPTYVRDRLNSFLRPERQDYIDTFMLATAAVVQAPRLRVVGE